MKKIAILIVAGLVVLSGCNATKSPTVAPTRTVSDRIGDIVIERAILSGLDNVSGLTKNNHRVAIDVFLGQVLLTGEVPSQAVIDQILDVARQTRGVTVVHNALLIAGSPKSQSHTVHENYLKAKLQAKLLKSDIRSNQYYITVRNDFVYLLGTLTAEQFSEVERLAKETDGIAGLKSLATLIVSQDIPAYIPQASAPVSTPVASQPIQNVQPTQGHQVPEGGYGQPYQDYNNTVPQPNMGYPNNSAINTGYNVSPTPQPNTNYPNSGASGAYNVSPIPNNTTTNSPYIQLYQGTNTP